MMDETPQGRLKRQLAELTDTHADDWFLVTKARYGLETVLRAVALKHGTGEVITQPFTCITAVNPILSAGHVPVYADTSARTLSIDTNTLQTSEETRALVVQHTFGIPADATACRAFADKHNLVLIEDSAHKLGLLATVKGKPLADVSVHSFGVEKMLPTKFGAAVWVNPDMADVPLHDAIRNALEHLPPLSTPASLRAKAYAPTNRLLNHIPTFLGANAIRRLLTRAGLFEAPIFPGELAGKNVGRATKPAVWMVRKTSASLKKYDAILKRRTHVGELYYAALTSHPTLEIPDDVQISEAMTRFPLICSSALEADALFSRLAERGLNPGKWYRPTLFPGPVDAGAYNYDAEACPVAERLSSRILNLPTNVTLEHAKEIIDALNS